MRIPKTVHEEIAIFDKYVEQWIELSAKDEGIYNDYIYPYIKDSPKHTVYVYDKISLLMDSFNSAWKVCLYKRHIAGTEWISDHCLPSDIKSPIILNNVDEAIQEIKSNHKELYGFIHPRIHRCMRKIQKWCEHRTDRMDALIDILEDNDNPYNLKYHIRCAKAQEEYDMIEENNK